MNNFDYKYTLSKDSRLWIIRVHSTPLYQNTIPIYTQFSLDANQRGDDEDATNRT